jgi:hypothetical protein
MIRKVLVAALVVLPLVACGGSDSPSAPSVPAPAPTPAPQYGGTYRGAMTYTGGGLNGFPITGTVTVTQTGSSLTLSSITTSLGSSYSYGLGTAPLTGSSFDGTSSYSSSGCGVVVSHYVGRFAGDLMNLTTTLVSTCGTVDIRGELTRQ